MLYETIHISQGALVEGRYILDVVLVANGVVDKQRRLGEEGMIFKINLKDYDPVDWGFLDHALERKGLGSRWTH